MKRAVALISAALMLLFLCSCKRNAEEVNKTSENKKENETKEPIEKVEGLWEVLTGVDLEEGFETPVIVRKP